MRAEAHVLSSLEKVVGRAKYPSDLFPREALHGVVVFSGQPHARLIAIDVDACLATRGVIDVLTSRDVPVNEYGLIVPDQPVLVGPGISPSGVDTAVSRWESDHVAFVVGETPDAAAAGAAALRCTWTRLPIVATLEDGLTDEVLVHPEHPAQSNTYIRQRRRRGSPTSAWSEAEVTIEGEYVLPLQEHAYLQPEAGVAFIDERGRVTIDVAGQWAHEDQRQISRVLDLPVDAVRVRYPAIGGAFGGREDLSVQVLLALAAWRLAARGERRPICTQWTRAESMVGHHKRHRGRIRARWGARRDGSLVVAETTCILDSGAYNSTTNKVLGNILLTVSGPYRFPHVKVDASAVYTNNVPGGAFRGFGAPQGAFVAESQMNKLATALDIDPVELRLRHCYREDTEGPSGVVLPAGVSLPEVVSRCRDLAAWGSAPVRTPDANAMPTVTAPDGAIRRGRGFACGFKNIGFSFGFPEACEASITLHGDDGDDEPKSADLYHGAADVGQGAHLALLKMAERATGVTADRIRCHFADTATSGDAGSASASRMTWMAGNAILGAAAEAEKRWRDGNRPAHGTFTHLPHRTEPLDAATGSGDAVISFGYVAQCVQVQVDLDTGHVFVELVWNVTDGGQIIDHVSAQGQVVGAVAQAVGYALLERLETDAGRLLNTRFATYLIPGVADVPTVVNEFLEIPDPQGPWGARGIGEMSSIPLAPAITAALHDAVGVWIDRLPITPEQVLDALRARIPHVVPRHMATTVDEQVSGGSASATHSLQQSGDSLAKHPQPDRPSA